MKYVCVCECMFYCLIREQIDPHKYVCRQLNPPWTRFFAKWWFYIGIFHWSYISFRVFLHPTWTSARSATVRIQTEPFVVLIRLAWLRHILIRLAFCFPSACLLLILLAKLSPLLPPRTCAVVPFVISINSKYSRAICTHTQMLRNRWFSLNADELISWIRSIAAAVDAIVTRSCWQQYYVCAIAGCNSR